MNTKWFDDKLKRPAGAPQVNVRWNFILAGYMPVRNSASSDFSLLVLTQRLRQEKYLKWAAAGLLLEPKNALKSSNR